MPGRARGNQVRLRPKTTRLTKSGYGDWSHHRLRCGISRCAARAGLSSRRSSYTSWHEGRRVLRSCARTASRQASNAEKPSSKTRVTPRSSHTVRRENLSEEVTANAQGCAEQGERIIDLDEAAGLDLRSKGDEVRFATDSPLEEAVWSEPVSGYRSNSGRF
jgi:hypothetical protein